MVAVVQVEVDKNVVIPSYVDAVIEEAIYYVLIKLMNKKDKQMFAVSNHELEERKDKGKRKEEEGDGHNPSKKIYGPNRNGKFTTEEKGKGKLTDDQKTVKERRLELHNDVDEQLDYSGGDTEYGQELGSAGEDNGMGWNVVTDRESVEEGELMQAKEDNEQLPLIMDEEMTDRGYVSGSNAGVFEKAHEEMVE